MFDLGRLILALSGAKFGPCFRAYFSIPFRVCSCAYFSVDIDAFLRLILAPFRVRSYNVCVRSTCGGVMKIIT